VNRNLRTLFRLTKQLSSPNYVQVDMKVNYLRVDFLPQRDVRIPKRAGGPIYPCIEKKFIELNPEGTITLR
jgi:hypothetical protein